LKGFDLRGKTLGVVGAGNIGMHVIKIARGFGMKVLVYDVSRNDFLQEVLEYSYVSLDELLKKSDIVTLHVPYCKETHHLINMKTVRMMKKGALLINTSRGGVVDTDALLYALEHKILSGIGLDVIEGEELIKEEKQLLYEKQTAETLALLAEDHKLLSKDNVLYTPHIAFYSEEALQRILDVTAENILCFIAKKPQNIVPF